VVHRTQRDHTAPVTCPACQTETLFIKLGETKIDHCQRCGGAWFDDGEVEALPEDLSEKAAAREAAEALGAMRRANAPETALPHYLTCPVCPELMVRRNYQQVSGVIIHKCQGHGTWLDRTNTTKLLGMIADGRLEEIEKRAMATMASSAANHVADLEAARQRHLWARRPKPPYMPGASQVRRIIWSLFDIFSD
jgi:Zn-finger nucleic acid-binding protein